ncbi:hypothetical protein AAG570_008948 [Ranatra chinensis]|uniref:E3 ubiquitin-protein ligase UBR4 N-terminal domain-containing protein n=1 Tax=Ranatra chinensis TaxID=642074 RepID=A0ABD0YSF6_9HEMI
MAANSSGVEWGSIVKPILAASYGSFNKNDITELAKAVIRSESELINHEEKYETFYTAFSALAADYISSSATVVSKSQLGVVCNACRILLRYLLMRLSGSGGQQGQSGGGEPLPVKQLLLPIKALCSAAAMLTRSDQIALTAIMKNAKLPPHIKTSMPVLCLVFFIFSGDTSSGENKEAKEGKVRSRADLSNQIMEQLTSPLFDFSFSLEPNSSNLSEGKLDSTNEKSYEIESIFRQRNITSLKSLGAGDVMLDMCLQLPHLARYTHKYNAAIAKKGFSLPCTLAEAQLTRHSLQAVVSDMGVVWSALSLPVLEPLTPARLEKLTTVTMTCLYCALSAATAASVYGVSSSVSPKTVPGGNAGLGKSGEDEGNLDSLATNVVEKALEIFNLMIFIIKKSTRTDGNVLQNYMLIGAWLLVSGLQAQLSASSQVPSEKSGKEEKGKSPSKCREGSARINLMKVQQGFGVLSVALGTRALWLVGQLLEDAQFEAMGAVTGVEQAPLSISATSSPLQRAVTILNATPINQFLFYLATVSYRKACTLKRIQKHPPEGDTFSTSDSTTYYEDEMSCSDESSPDVDDDSEPLLGLWFEETISVPECENSTNPQSQEMQETPAKPSSAPTSSVVPEKGEPNGFILLASQIFHVMNKYLVTSESGFLNRYVETGLTEQQMVMLAAIIRDLDRETARTDTGTISVYFGATLGQLYSEFSHALTQYTHNLLARNLLSESLQSTLLLHLGVNPFSSNTDNNTWPLQVYPRTLAVLAQVLLLKPQSEKETACINIWQRLISTLVDNIHLRSTNADVDNEDLNVEHAQLVLFLFHSLNLMQKKSVLMLCSTAIILVSHYTFRVMRESQLMHLSRLLLLLDYLVKHLYDAPPALLEQVQWNLLSGTSLGSSSSGGTATRLFSPCSDIEDNYRRLMPQDEFSMRPKFYSLTYGEVNNQEPPKLDGLACNFILGTPDKVKYPELLDALIDVLNVTYQCNVAIRSMENISYTWLCAIQYCFTICWRLLLQLPPSTNYLEKLDQDKKAGASPLLLHSLIWGPRAAHKTFIPWMKDCLVKQGMYTQYAECALKNVADVVNNPMYDISVSKICISTLMPQIATSGKYQHTLALPNLMDLCILDAVVAKVQATLDQTAKTPASESESNKTIQTTEMKPNSELIQDLLPQILQLAEAILICSRSSLMYQISEDEGGANFTDGDLSAFCSALAISSTKCSKTQALATAINQLLPASVTSAVEKWNAYTISSFPSVSSIDFE